MKDSADPTPPPSAASIRAAREKRGLKISDLARLTGASRNTITGWENGTQEPGTDYAKALRDVFGDDLIEPTPPVDKIQLGFIRRRAKAIAEQMEQALQDQHALIADLTPDDPATLSAKSKRTATQHAAKSAHPQSSKGG